METECVFLKDEFKGDGFHVKKILNTYQEGIFKFDCKS